jgi:hypothetical protein
MVTCTQFSGVTPEANTILKGRHVEDMGIPMSDELKTFLEELRHPSKSKNFESPIDTDSFVYGIKGWKETTSTSPSGRHLGHYKAVLTSPTVLSTHVRMINLPIKYGFAWCLSVTPLIEKTIGSPFLTRL